MPTINYHCVGGLLLGETPPSGARLDYLADALGSVVATADQSAAVRNEYRYAPYGRATARLGPDPDPAFLWTGESGSRGSEAAHAGQYNRARHYARETGRWTSVDPLWPAQPAYAYVGGNPATWTDPDGRRVRRCPIHGGEPGCVFSGPPGSENSPTYWHWQTPMPERRTFCYTCLKDLYHRTGKAYKGVSGKPNAMRHCVGSCLANQECGGSCAPLIIVHEFQTWFSEDSRIDRHNNDVGAIFGKRVPGSDGHKMCGEACKKGLR